MEVDQSEFGQPQNFENQQQTSMENNVQQSNQQIEPQQDETQQPTNPNDNTNPEEVQENEIEYNNEPYDEQQWIEPVVKPTLFDKIKWFISNNWKKILIVLLIIIVVCSICKAKREGYIKIPFIDGTTGYIKHQKDKSENKASAIIEDANGNVIYSQTTQPVSRINYDYEQMLPTEISHGGISVENM